MHGDQETNAIGEMSLAELDQATGGLDIGPLHVATGDGVLTVGLFKVGIFVGEGCVGVYGGGRAFGVCF
jgi:hypothetical protein